MIQKLKGSGRRILTFPAVHPCLKISPSTLLSSILNLSHSICNFKSKFFASNKRNAREAIRLVGVLQIFLEEIRDEQSNLLDSVVIAFCELHLVFQKLQFLLEDCTREGAQVWMLMESENVANQFRVSARSIATALDILPLDSIEVSMELKEHFELVMRQSRKARFEVDPDDKRAAMDVVSTLKQFENGIFPSDIDLKRVLDHIGIRTWSECNKEVKFLDSEIGLECLNEEKIKVAWLSSLMGFMNYCRCVVFDVVKGEGDQQSDGRGSSRDSEVLASLNPYDFRCPISLELMSEPVTILSGHTYDRSSILKWFKGGNVNCPKTGQRLNNTKWVPNLVLQRLIQQYCSEKGISIADQGRRNRDATRTVHPGSLAAKEAMKMLASFLAYRLETGVGEERNGAAYEFRLLSKANIFNRSCLVEAGCIQHLLKLLSSKDSSTQENAIASLLNISKHSKSITVIVENRGLELIVDVLKKGMKVEARQHAAATLFYLASIEEYRRLIGETTEAIPALIELIKDGTDRAKKNALVAMFGLLMNPENQRRVLAAGAIPLLVNLLRSCQRDDLVTDSLAILATLADKYEGTIAILQCGALHLAVEILSSSTSRMGKEYCVCLLLSLSMHGGADVLTLLVKSPSLIGSLYSLLSEGTSRANKKASALISVLHEFCERSSSSLKSPVIPQQFIHVW